VSSLVEPYRAEAQGQWAAAAADWERRGMPYEAACALARTDAIGRRRAIEVAERLGAQPLLDRLTSE
jgi:hypothetical protein